MVDNYTDRKSTEFVHIRLGDELYDNLLNLSTDLEVKLPNVLRTLCDRTLDEWDKIENPAQNTVLLFQLKKPVRPNRTITLRLSMRLQKRIMKYKRAYNRTITNLVYNLIESGYRSQQSNQRKTA